MANTTNNRRSPSRPSAKTAKDQTPSFEIRGPKNGAIRSVDDWHDQAPPKARKKRWKDGRSAKELATAWLGPVVPPEVADFFQANPTTRGFRVDEALAEHVTPLDKSNGQKRNHDLLLVGRAGGKSTVVGIEAKADESFGESLGDHLRKTKSGKKKKPAKGLERLKTLTKGLFGRTIDDDPKLAELRLQLISGAAGTLIEAKNKKASRAVYLIHVFKSSNTKPAKLGDNEVAVGQFLRSFKGVKAPRTKGSSRWLAGPIEVPGEGPIPNDIPLYVGVVTTDLSRRG